VLVNEQHTGASSIFVYLFILVRLSEQVVFLIYTIYYLIYTILPRNIYILSEFAYTSLTAY